MNKRKFFKIEGNKIIRMRKHCPKCGPGVFLAEHKNRFGCGKCGYTEFKGGVKPPVEKEKPIETPVKIKPEIPIKTSETTSRPPSEQKTDEPSSETENIKDTQVDSSKSTEESIKERADGDVNFCFYFKHIP